MANKHTSRLSRRFRCLSLLGARRTGRAHQVPTRRLAFDTLEERRLLSVDFWENFYSQAVQLPNDASVVLKGYTDSAADVDIAYINAQAGEIFSLSMSARDVQFNEFDATVGYSRGAITAEEYYFDGGSNLPTVISSLAPELPNGRVWHFEGSAAVTDVAGNAEAASDLTVDLLQDDAQDGLSLEFSLAASESNHPVAGYPSSYVNAQAGFSVAPWGGWLCTSCPDNHAPRTPMLTEPGAFYGAGALNTTYRSLPRQDPSDFLDSVPLDFNLAGMLGSHDQGPPPYRFEKIYTESRTNDFETTVSESMSTLGGQTANRMVSGHVDWSIPRAVADFGVLNASNSVLMPFGASARTFLAPVTGTYQIVVQNGHGHAGLSNYQLDVERVTSTSGVLDSTFGDSSQVGKTVTDVSRLTHDVGRGLAYQSDGKLIAVGESDGDMAVVRYNPDGSLDSTFGIDGKVRIDFGTNDSARSVAVDSADRVVVAGLTTQGLGSSYRFALARLTADGELDTNFDGDGKQTIFFGGTTESANSVAVDSLDRVVVAGGSNQGHSFDLAVARLTALGALDTTFDSDGRQIVTFPSGSSNCLGVTIDSLDQVLLAGGTGSDMAVARLTANGMLDNEFGTGGRQTIDFGGTENATAIAVDGNDRVLVAGSTRQFGYSIPDFAVARLLTSGALDDSFDVDGKQTIDFSGGYDESAAVAVDSANRVLLAGTTFPGVGNLNVESEYHFAVARLASNGTVDNTFDTDGRQMIAFNPYGDNAFAIAVDALDQVVVGGYTTPSATGDFVIARLTTLGAPDPSFNYDGKTTTEFGRRTDDHVSRTTTYQSDGKALVVGNSDGDLAVLRYNADGSRDQTFGIAGRVLIDFPNNFDDVAGVAVDSAGHVIAAGEVAGNWVVVRLDSDGTRDGLFAVGGIKTLTVGGGVAALGGVAVDSADRVLLAGTQNSDFVGVRLTASGAIDTSFDADGKQSIDFGGTLDGADSVIVDSLDRVLVAGYSIQNGAPGHDFALARLTSSGTLDATFSGDGKQTIDFGDTYDQAYDITIDKQGRAIVAGFAAQDSAQFAVARLTSGGELDTDFDGDGKQRIDFAEGDEIAYAVAVDSYNRVLVAGTAIGAVDRDFGVVRLAASGALDETFDADGRQTIDFGYSDDTAYGVAVDSADRVLLAGDTRAASSPDRDYALARLTTIIHVNSATIQDDLQNLVHEIQSAPAGVGPSQPQVTLAVEGSQLSAVVSAVEGLTLAAGEPTFTVVVQFAEGSYSGQNIDVPVGVRLVINSASGPVTFVGASPALTVSSGDIEVSGVLFTNATDAPTIRVTGGSLKLRDSVVRETTGGSRAAIEITGGHVDLGTATDLGDNTFDVSGAGELIRNLSSTDVSAVGNLFQINGATLADGISIESAIYHHSDSPSLGTVDFGFAGIFVPADGNLQNAIDVAPALSTIHVAAGNTQSYSVVAKLLTVAFSNGVTVLQRADTLNPSTRSLTITGSSQDDVISFLRSGTAGAILAEIHGLPTGSFSPTGRLISQGAEGDDDLSVDGSITLRAVLDGGSGDDRLKGGAGHDILLGGLGDDLLVGGDGRDFLIGGAGADRQIGNADEDILVAGTTDFDGQDAALAAIMSEWTSARSYAARTANISGVNNSSFGSRLNGGFYLNVDASRGAVTVHDDGEKDMLTGSNGQDWFFANLILDAGDDADQNDKITDLSAPEFAIDLDFTEGF